MRALPGEAFDIIISSLVGCSHHPVCQILHHLIPETNTNLMHLQSRNKTCQIIWQSNKFVPELHLLAEREVISALHHELYQLAQFGFNLDGMNHVAKNSHIPANIPTGHTNTNSLSRNQQWGLVIILAASVKIGYKLQTNQFALYAIIF